MTSSKITIKDVARKAGVSIATVSRYINQSHLKESNRSKVEKAVNELGYQPMLYARRLAGGKLGSFGLIIPGYEGIFYSFYALEIIRQIASSLDEQVIDLHLHIFWNKDSFRASLVDGVIMADVIGNEKQVKRLLKEEVPLVVMNRNVDIKEVNCVYIDNFKGAFEATEFLIQHGHRNIVHLAGDLNVQCAQDRLAGFKAALEKGGIGVDKDTVYNTHFSRKEARDAMEVLFRAKNKPTAIFCCSDDVASEVLSFAEEKRIDVPKELSLIGFDDNPHCLYGNLMLTTVRQPLPEMARVAVKMLNENQNGLKPAQRVVLDTELIIRDTVSFK